MYRILQEMSPHDTHLRCLFFGWKKVNWISLGILIHTHPHVLTIADSGFCVCLWTNRGSERVGRWKLNSLSAEYCDSLARTCFFVCTSKCTFNLYVASLYAAPVAFVLATHYTPPNSCSAVSGRMVLLCYLCILFIHNWMKCAQL